MNSRGSRTRIWIPAAMLALSVSALVYGNARTALSPQEKADAVKSVTIRWLGQSCYLMTTSGGTRIVTDPVNFKGYHFPKGTEADIVTVSHEHIDHNSVEVVAGEPLIVRGTDKGCLEVNAIDKTIGDVRLYTVPSFHDPGMRRKNAIFVFEFDGIRLVHLGDIGTVLSEDQIKAIGKVDILMIPVGGQYTIDGAGADTIVKQLAVSRFVLPMHYKTEAFEDIPRTVDSFLEGKANVRRIDGNTFVFDAAVPATRMEYVVTGYK